VSATNIVSLLASNITTRRFIRRNSNPSRKNVRRQD